MNPEMRERLAEAALERARKLLPNNASTTFTPKNEIDTSQAEHLLKEQEQNQKRIDAELEEILQAKNEEAEKEMHSLRQMSLVPTKKLQEVRIPKSAKAFKRQNRNRWHRLREDNRDFTIECLQKNPRLANFIMTEPNYWDSSPIETMQRIAKAFEHDASTKFVENNPDTFKNYCRHGGNVADIALKALQSDTPMLASFIYKHSDIWASNDYDTARHMTQTAKAFEAGEDVVKFILANKNLHTTPPRS